MRTVKPFACCLLALSFVIVLAPRAEAWGFPGHRIIVRVAFKRLSTTAQARIGALLGGEPLTSAVTWPDIVANDGTMPETYRWHFVDIPTDEDRYDKTRDCALTSEGDCVIRALERCRTTLTTSGHSAPERRNAFSWLIHFYGDIHQPLHCAERNGDEGGNGVIITWFGSATYDGKKRKLHKAWDNFAIERTGKSENAYVAKLLDRIEHMPEAEREAMENGTLVEWAEDGHDIAVEKVYGKLPPPNASGVYELEKDYYENAIGVIDDQLVKAIVRLEHELEEIFGGSVPSPGPSPQGLMAGAAPGALTRVYFNAVGGQAYHRRTCRFVGPSSSRTTIGAARRRGLAACRVCDPPE
jgi:nuclease S1